jgi:hypothetical protein
VIQLHYNLTEQGDKLKQIMAKAIEDKYTTLSGNLFIKIDGKYVRNDKVIIYKGTSWNCSCGSYLESGAWCPNCGYQAKKLN